MLSLKYKDFRNRKILFQKEKFQKISKFLFINFLNNTQKYFINPLFFLKFQKKYKILKSHIKSRCLITNRSRSVNKNFGLSRIKLRELMQFGILPGFKKSCW